MALNSGFAQKLRRGLGWLGTLAAVFLLGAMVDIVVVRQRTPFNVVQILPGQEEAIDGPLAEKTRVSDLGYTSDSPDLEVVFDETYTGFWLGGEKWRGRLRVKPTAKPGKYLVTIQPRQPLVEAPPLPYRVYVHPDVGSWRRSSPSFCVRFLGLAPGWLAAMSLGLLLLTGSVIYWLSGRIDSALAAAGLAEVYQVRRSSEGWELSFGLGSDHGLQEGSWVWLLDPAGKQVAEMEVREVSRTHATARTSSGHRFAPGYLVQLKGKKPPAD